MNGQFSQQKNQLIPIPTLKIELKYSSTYFMILSFVYSGAMIILLRLPFSQWITIGSVLLIGWRLVNCLKKDVFLKSTASIKSIAYQSNQWLLKTNTGEIIPAQLQSSSFSSLLLLLLRFKTLTTKKSLNIVIFNDSCDTDSFRQLRTKLTGIRLN